MFLLNNSKFKQFDFDFDNMPQFDYNIPPPKLNIWWIHVLNIHYCLKFVFTINCIAEVTNRNWSSKCLPLGITFIFSHLADAFI